MERSVTLLIFIITAATLTAIPIISWPFDYLATYFHEISHGIIALLTGGSIYKIRMYLFGGGICEVKGGWQFLVAFSGYAGATIWGVFIYLTATTMRAKNAKCFAKGVVFMVSLSLFFWARDITTILILLSIIMLFITMVIVRSVVIIRIITQFTGIYVLLKSIISPLSLIDGRHYGDGARLSNITLIPEIVWVLLWVSIGMGGLIFIWRFAGKAKGRL